MISGRFTWNSPGRPGAAALLLIPLLVLSAGVLLGSNLLLGAGALFGLLLAISRPLRLGVSRGLEAFPADPSPDSLTTDMTADGRNPVQLAGWMAAAWFCGLLVAVPLYHPYPRLSLPWLLPCWIAAAAGLNSLMRSTDAKRDLGILEKLGVGGLAAIVCLFVAIAVGSARWRGAPLSPARFPAWQDRSELKEIARRILADAERSMAELPPSKNPDVAAVFYVYGEPAIFFHLESLADERFISQPAGNLSLTLPGATDPGVATFLITGMHARSNSAEFVEATRDLKRIATYDYEPSLLVRLDDAADVDQSVQREQVELFLVHPPQ